MDPVASVIALDILKGVIVELGKDKLKHVLNVSAADAGITLGDSFRERKPTAAFVGFGHCGDTILRQVAKELAGKRSERDAKNSPARKQNALWSWLRPSKHDISNLIEPYIVVGDLDKNSTPDAADDDYKLLNEMPLRSLASSGSGNMPAKAQHLSRLALSVRDLGSEKKGSSWKVTRSALIDTIGVSDKNQLRLVTYLFSAGGGSGSGFLYEIAQAQRYQQLNRLFNSSQGEAVELGDIAFTLGAAVLPGTSGAVDAQSVNSGRFLCKYLSDRHQASIGPKISTIPAYHSVVLFSNGSFEGAKLSQKERMSRANNYISKQLLAIVFSQTQATDGEKQEERAVGAEDLIHLDPSDLRHAICGVSVVGFNYSTEKPAMSELLAGAFKKPVVEGDSFSGVSVDVGSYDILKPKEGQKSDPDLALIKLSELDVFKYCPGVTVVLSVAKNQLSASEIDSLRECLVVLFPNARVRRVAIVEASVFAIAVFVSESGIFCEEAKRHFGNYLVNAFLQQPIGDAENLSTAIGGECQPLAMVETQAFLDQVARRLKVDNVLFDDVLLKKSDASAALEYITRLRKSKGLEDGFSAVEQWFSSSSGPFSDLAGSGPTAAKNSPSEQVPSSQGTADAASTEGARSVP